MLLGEDRLGIALTGNFENEANFEGSRDVGEEVASSNVVVKSLKALDSDRPIREADIVGAKVKNPNAPAVKREAEEDWGRRHAEGGHCSCSVLPTRDYGRCFNRPFVVP